MRACVCACVRACALFPSLFVYSLIKEMSFHKNDFVITQATKKVIIYLGDPIPLSFVVQLRYLFSAKNLYELYLIYYTLLVYSISYTMPNVPMSRITGGVIVLEMLDCI